MGNSGRFNTFNIKRALSYCKRNGLRSTYYKVLERIERDRDERDYITVAMHERPTSMELNEQVRRKFFHSYKFSLLVPAFNSDPVLFREMMASVVRQTYDNWELCIADGSENDGVENCVKEYCKSLDKETAEKIRYQRLNTNRGIAGNSNGALVMAGGDYVALLDHDDVLSPDALFEIMDVLDEGLIRDGNVYRNRYKAIYSDEDKINAQGTRYFDFHRKPDFDIDLLRSNNYICHLFAVKTSVAVKAGGFRSEYNGAQDHDFILRCIEQLDPSEIYHIPKALYHWRSTPSSTAENPDSKLYAYEAGKKAVTDHLKRLGIEADVTDTAHLGFFRVKYHVTSPSVKIMDRSEWESLTKEDIEKLNEELIMVMGPDIKPLTADFTDELAGVLLRPEVGAVGGKIYDKKGRIDSAGYIYDEKGELKPDYRGMNGNYSGYMHRASIQHKTDGLAADCMMIKKAAIVYKDRPVMSDKFITVYDPFAEFKRRS
ncbi:MAG: glycosyltransferase [Lachnospiraceae bacterium]|nr:glycosyltransferase [Lachnospiraceae bacterium]